jgi:transposase InsO family protein
MSTASTFFCTLGYLLGALWELARYAVRFGWALLLPKALLAARLVAAESQLAVELNDSGGGRERRRYFTAAFRILWVVLSKLLDGWKDLVHLMKPETVKRWHKRAFRMFWRWRSRPGRPAISSEMQRIVRQMSAENSLWGPDRIRDTLLLLGYRAPCAGTIRKYMVRPRKPRPESTNWLPFLRNHLEVSWAIDFFTVTTLGFQVLYVFLVFDHARREVLHFAVTPHPAMQWVIQQLREATPFGKQPRYVFRDNDRIFGYGVRALLERCGIQEVRTAYRSPWQNPYLERMMGTLRQELLDHVILLNQRHLERLLREYLEQYYHTARPHQGLGGETPIMTETAGNTGTGELIAIPVVGGLHHRYQRRAA